MGFRSRTQITLLDAARISVGIPRPRARLIPIGLTDVIIARGESGTRNQARVHARAARVLRVRPCQAISQALANSPSLKYWSIALTFTKYDFQCMRTTGQPSLATLYPQHYLK